MTDTTADTSFAASIGYKALKRHGIATLTVGYDGESDSGCITDLVAFAADGTRKELPDATVKVTLHDSSWDTVTGRWDRKAVVKRLPVTEAVEQWTYDILEDKFPGWEIDGGSHGTITIDVAKRKASLEHNARTVDYDTTELEI